MDNLNSFESIERKEIDNVTSGIHQFKTLERFGYNLNLPSTTGLGVLMFFILTVLFVFSPTVAGWTTIATIVIGLLIMLLNFRRNHMLSEVLLQTAKAHNWSYRPKMNVNTRGDMGIMFGRSTNEKFLHYIDQATIRDYQACFYLYKYTITVNRGIEYRQHAILEIETDIKTPYILLDSINNEELDNTMYISEENQIELEGDFSHHFRLFVQNNSGSTALAIITPDVMHTLIDASADYEVEIIDGVIRFIAPDGDYATTLIESIDIACRVMDSIERNLEVHQLEKDQHTVAQWSYKRGNIPLTADFDYTETIKAFGIGALIVGIFIFNPFLGLVALTVVVIWIFIRDF
jgi:hypothetical protein